MTKTGKCASDGKTFAVTYTDINGDFGDLGPLRAKGVKDEVPDATIQKIMSTRAAGEVGRVT